VFSSPAAFVGFLLGGGLPVGFGILILQAHYASVASLRPGEAACGMPALGGFGMILIVGPIGGMAGLILGGLTAWLWNCVRRAIIGRTEDAFPEA
jgi:hypothetical protein